MRDEAWTAERIGLLKELWAEGATAAVIAARLGGMSRSAVLGKVFRLRLGAEKGAAKAQAKKRAAPARDKRATLATVTASAEPVRATPTPHRYEGLLVRRRSSKQNALSASPPAAERQHKTLLELTNNSCRWPHGRPGATNFFFCGAPDAALDRGIPYCAHHMRRAYGDYANIVAEQGRGAPNAALLSAPSASSRGQRLLSIVIGHKWR